MPSLGPNTPGTLAEIPSGHPAGEVAWLAVVGNVQTLDAVFADCAPWIEDPPAPGVPTQYLEGGTAFLILTNFGFSVPSGHVVTNISVAVSRKQETPRYAGTTVRDYKIQLYFAGITGTNKAAGTSLPDTVTAATYSDTPSGWGVTNVGSAFNASTFGIGIAYEGDGGPVPIPIVGDPPPTVFVDLVTITLTTQPAGHVRPLSGDSLATSNVLRSMVIR